MLKLPHISNFCQMLNIYIVVSLSLFFFSLSKYKCSNIAVIFLTGIFESNSHLSIGSLLSTDRNREFSMPAEDTKRSDLDNIHVAQGLNSSLDHHISKLFNNFPYNFSPQNFLFSLENPMSTNKFDFH